ncbi:MAG: spore coat protein [Actinomycetales bacterium]|nr:spore coat protein [Actinomycetales bacterium]
MRTIGVLQARMTSSRLPGKVLQPILGAPMVLRQIERVRRATTLDGLVLATSIDPTDDELADVVTALGVPVVRGSLDDVLARFVQAIDTHGIDVVVRLTADCPLASPVVVDRVVSAFDPERVDYVSNTLQPTYPDGLDVEVVKADVLRWVAAHSDDPHEREHVTLGVYRRPDRFRVLNVSGEQDLSDLRWTVDTPDDLAFVRQVYERLYPGDPAFDVDDILDLLAQEPALNRTTEHAARNAALDGLDTGAMHG